MPAALLRRVVAHGRRFDCVARLAQSESHPSFDRDRWQLERVGDVSAGEPAVEGQRDYLPLRLRKPLEHALERFRFGAEGIGVGAGDAVYRQLARGTGQDSLGVLRFGGRGTWSTRSRFRGRAGIALAPASDGKRLLEDPDRLGRRAGTAVGHVPGSVLIAVKRQLERRLSSCLHAPHRLFVGLVGAQKRDHSPAGETFDRGGELVLAPSWNATLASITSRLPPWETSVDSP